MTLIDWEHLMSLRADIGEEDFADVAFLFFSEIGQKLTELRAAPDHVGLEDFHFLKGSAANLGFAAMAEACEAGEVACEAGDAPDLDAVIHAFEGALAELRPRLPELHAA